MKFAMKHPKLTKAAVSFAMHHPKMAMAAAKMAMGGGSGGGGQLAGLAAKALPGIAQLFNKDTFG
jgi:hypothetical protein